ncbi:cytochrome P-450 cyp509A1 [Cunninghamella echinulata]|nr:cytochrome P-450 cyp509A1 [Cunninghamella echinulata]
MSRLILNTINQYTRQWGVLDWYGSHFSTLTNTKTKRISLGLAITLTLISYTLHKITTPPKALRHIPHVPVWKLIYHFVIKQHNSPDMHEALGKPYIKKGNGFYLLLDRCGWVIQVACPVAAKQVFFKGDVFPKIEGSAPKDTYLEQYCGNENILFSNGHEWLKHRKIANSAFHRSMPVQLFGDSIKRLFKMWDNDHPSGVFTVDIQKIMLRIALDTIGQAAFGFEFNALIDENSEWKKCYDVINEAGADPLFAIFPAFDQKYRWLFPKRVEQFKTLYKFRDLLTKAIEEKRELFKQKKFDNTIRDSEKDLLTLMLESEYNGEGALTNEEIINDIAIFFVAGHDTSAYSLASAIYYLSKHPDIQEKARQEVNSILCPNGELNEDILPTYEDTKKFQFVTQIIKETLRISPSVNFLVSPRSVARDIDLNGTFVPEGSQLNISIYGLHHNPFVWSNPDVFDPDRFSPGGEADQKADNAIPWAPFSNGNRICPGYNFSLTQQRIILASLLRKYEWTLPDNSMHKDKLKSRFSLISINPDLYIDFKKRY